MYFMISDVLKKIIEECSESQVRIAEALGVSQPTLSNYIYGRRAPDETFIRNFCKYFGITPNELYGFETVLSRKNKERYRDIIETVEYILLQSKKTLAPADKAILISSLFDEDLKEESAQDINKYVQFFLNTKAS